ncbi:MAG: hypothetical protein JWO94_1163 [Verrucomicrobiaceae bacterium]|nr:hypothetical protein [Verrucomicrobiaceae bacterium]
MAAARETICEARATVDTRCANETVAGVKPAVLLLLLPVLVISASALEPMTSRTDTVGLTLNHWAAERTAAGFKELNYEDRDAGHSLLPADTFHGLSFLQPTDEDKKAGRDKGPAFIVRPLPVIGNCSMAGPANAIGSLGRAYLVDEHGHAFLFSQYLHNNLIIYPEHQDHDPGANGAGGGWGDMFPANTPATLISQGSSYSDMPFVKAMLSTAAAFSPALQEGLIRQRILMPTLQAIFRQSNKQVQTTEDYFSGKAHPPVFDGAQIDELKMITLAHTMSAQTVPPLAFVEVLSERACTPGADFFESPRFTSEKLGTTPVNLARIYRGSAEEYVLAVSAGHSIDTQKRPLHYRWEILQGRKDLIRIDTTNEGARATLHVRWHPPLTSAAGIRSHRVDIGLFVTNGVSTSAPAIISFYMLPNEQRFFDKQGRLAEICYQAGNPELGLPADNADLRWLSLIQAAGAVDESLLFHSFSEVLSNQQRKAFSLAWRNLSPLKSDWDRLSADPAAKELADKQRTVIGQAITDFLASLAPRKDHQPGTMRAAAETAINSIVAVPDFFVAHQADILAQATRSSNASAVADLQAELNRLTNWSVLVEKKGSFAITHPMGQLTEADRYYLRQLHLTVLSQVLLPGTLERSPAPLFADARLTTPKSWRDVYHYDSKGARAGWERFFQGHILQFDAAGRLLDPKGVSTNVSYQEDAGLLYFNPQGSKN